MDCVDPTSKMLLLHSPSTGIATAADLATSVSISLDTLPLIASVVSLDPSTYLLSDVVVDALMFVTPCSSKRDTKGREGNASTILVSEFVTRVKITIKPEKEAYCRILLALFEEKYYLLYIFNVVC